ncbi:MAG TPA: hypothetical protein VGC79_07180, partial [Polyangiaceae bacterium]
GIVHYAVANIPGAVPGTSTRALCNATLPYVLQLAGRGLEGAARENPSLVSAINIHRGAIAYAAVAETFGLEHRPWPFEAPPIAAQ